MVLEGDGSVSEKVMGDGPGGDRGRTGVTLKM